MPKPKREKRPPINKGSLEDRRMESLQRLAERLNRLPKERRDAILNKPVIARTSQLPNKEL